MIAIIQRVKNASVIVDGALSGEICAGITVLLGVIEGDGEEEAVFLAKKTANLRIFGDENGKMNLSLLDIGGEALVISNFTLGADASHGNRPSYEKAARPEKAEPLYELFKSELAKNGVKKVASGVFGASMEVKQLGDGPVTLLLDTEKIMKKH